jgi:hypothetical protein
MPSIANHKVATVRSSMTNREVVQSCATGILVSFDDVINVIQDILDRLSGCRFRLFV